ncbi:MAG: SAM-dependent chlorinase/fluorinase [Acidobacteria bacterium]|nr:SAM-dependent chlorinase/fluorinase [Acidobacteriota bacterium]MBI3421849.1 SAM-dependent chlorinase/fluorinase [Acidobacteriota bacterium]
MITLLTDFGTTDYFVPAVKGVILTLQPSAQLIDLTHDIPAQDIQHAAFTLGACYRNFPPGTIHLAVVDPGVGSARRPLVVAAGQYFFVGPDNGLFSFVYAREPEVRVYHAARPEFHRPQPSATFHGRDVFAPLVAWLARGIHPTSFGPEISDYVRLAIPQPQADADANTISGEIIHIDRFGNCLTNFTESELPLTSALCPPPPMFSIGEHAVTQFGTHFAQAAQPEQLFAYLGSAGYWEVALWCGSAAARGGIVRGAKVKLIW